MRTIGFPISLKENEKRRVVIPKDITKECFPENMYFEEGYGNVMGISDKEYLEAGCNICSRDEVLKQDIICDLKAGDAKYIKDLKVGQILFGWIHATQNEELTDIMIKNKLTAYAWGNMNYRGRHIFWRNNEIAGESSVLHAFQCFGLMPYDAKVAVIGRGNTAKGAINILNKLGAEVTQYNRKTENLLREELGNYDVIVNCVLWDLFREDHIINKDDLKKMKKGSMIIDVSCDKNGAIETSIPTTFQNPVYYVDGILHYVVDHTPSIYYKTFTKYNSKLIMPYIKMLIKGEEDEVLKEAKVIENGNIIDKDIIEFQDRGE